ncbi:MAG: hypothetical protein WCG73_02015 [Candidatus Moraniibacteriota bacterium]
MQLSLLFEKFLLFLGWSLIGFSLVLPMQINMNTEGWQAGSTDGVTALMFVPILFLAGGFMSASFWVVFISWFSSILFCIAFAMTCSKRKSQRLKALVIQIIAFVFALFSFVDVSLANKAANRNCHLFDACPGPDVVFLGTGYYLWQSALFIFVFYCALRLWRLKEVD